MATLNQTANDQDTPFHQHSLYRLATRHLAQGETGEAIQQLRLLAEIYPEESGLRDMLMRAEMQAALVEEEEPAVQRREASPFLQRLLTFLLVLTVGLMVVAGFYYLYDRWVIQDQRAAEEAQAIASKRAECQAKVDGGSWDEAQTCCQELLAQAPDDAYCPSVLPTVQASQALDGIWVQGREAEERCYAQWDMDACQRALDAYRQVHAQDPAFNDVEQRILKLEELFSLEARWQEAQPCIQSQDWACVIDRVEQVYRQDPSFRDPTVRDTLISAYVQLAQQRIAQASGDVATLREAIDLLDRAFQRGLTDPNLRLARELANNYVLGVEALERGDQEQALIYWRRAYDKDPNYLNGLVRERLRELAPEVARRLIDEAEGDAGQLTVAIDYLDLALELRPDDAELRQERELAQAFVDGVLAYTREEEPDYCGAMDLWGQIYRVRPEYQAGALQERLRLACERCQFPDAEVCTP
jgi:tetratricopeptide (TPR) repeat protein